MDVPLISLKSMFDSREERQVLLYLLVCGQEVSQRTFRGDAASGGALGDYEIERAGMFAVTIDVEEH